MTEYAIDIVTASDPSSEHDLPHCFLNISIHITQNKEDKSIHNQHLSQKLRKHCFFLCNSFSAGRPQVNSS